MGFINTAFATFVLAVSVVCGLSAGVVCSLAVAVVCSLAASAASGASVYSDFKFVTASRSGCVAEGWVCSL